MTECSPSQQELPIENAKEENFMSTLSKDLNKSEHAMTSYERAVL